MIYLDLFLGFLQVGLFSFGGAYGAIPVIREIVMKYNWMDEAKFAYILAISESTPGPIMVNTATYIGNEVGGILGAALATFTVCLPAFLIILLFSILLKNALKNPYVQAVLSGIKPCIIGIIVATGLYMIIDNCLQTDFTFANLFGDSATVSSGFSIAWQSIAITILLAVTTFIYNKIKKKAIPPILLIIVSACLGMAIYAI